MLRIASAVLLLGALVSSSPAQEKAATKPDSAPAQAQPEARRPASATSRLLQAKTVYIKKGSGTTIAYNVVSQLVENWGRFTLVNEEEKADITIEVTAPEEGGGITVSSSTTTSPITGRPEQTSSTTRQIGSGPVRMLVTETKTKLPLFMASENVKYAMKQKTREDNLVDAAERLVGKFRERVEPTETGK